MRGWLKLLAFSILVAMFDFSGTIAAGGQAPLLKPESGPWNPTGSFSFEGNSKKMRRALSGIACHNSSSAQHICLVVFDEGVEARYVVIHDGSYNLDDERVILTTDDGELDAEAAATDGQYYYITGSHSVKREGCEANPVSRQVIRIGTDPTTGKARHEPDIGPVGESDNGRLWTPMSQQEELKGHVGKCLGAPDQGVNIEGLAVKDGRLYFGFRGPADDGVAKILSVDANALFTDGGLSLSITSIEVGKGRGIRDLQAVQGGFLVLSGPDDTKVNEDKSWVISFWDGTSSAGNVPAEPKLLAELDLTEVKRPTCDKEVKPEALAATEDAPDHYTLVVLSDGMCDGGALEFRINR